MFVSIPACLQTLTQSNDWIASIRQRCYELFQRGCQERGDESQSVGAHGEYNSPESWTLLCMVSLLLASSRTFNRTQMASSCAIRQYRYKTLMALKSPLDDELRLMDELAIKHLKTYQVWHHRRLLVQQTRNPGPELEFIANSLQIDMKNYHTWSYRQWILAHFNDDELWSHELDFVES